MPFPDIQNSLVHIISQIKLSCKGVKVSAYPVMYFNLVTFVSFKITGFWLELEEECKNKKLVKNNHYY